MVFYSSESDSLPDCLSNFEDSSFPCDLISLMDLRRIVDFFQFLLLLFSFLLVKEEW